MSEFTTINEVKYQYGSPFAYQVAADAIVNAGIQGGFKVTVDLDIPQADFWHTGELVPIEKNSIIFNTDRYFDPTYPESEAYFCHIVFDRFVQEKGRPSGYTLKMSKWQVDSARHEIANTPQTNLGFFIDHCGGSFFVAQEHLYSLHFVDRKDIKGHLQEQQAISPRSRS